VFDSAYDDTELLGKAVTRGESWQTTGVLIHLANGAAFGAAYAHVAPHMPLPSWARGPVAAVGEHVALWPLTAVSDRLHPARDELPALGGSRRAFGQGLWRHLLFGIVLGEIERRLNPPKSADIPSYEHIVSSNGHGRLESAVSGPAQ
jgi:hypothetical protein